MLLKCHILACILGFACPLKCASDNTLKDYEKYLKTIVSDWTNT